MSKFLGTGSIQIGLYNEHIIYENFIKCTVKDYEFNYSYNPTLSISGSTFKDFVNDSHFQPYVTTLGLYNDKNELLAVAKFGQPVPVSQNTDMTYLIKFDL